MQAIDSIGFLKRPLFLGVLLAGAIPPVASAQSFTITATNVTMPASGGTSSQFTLTSINGYSGNILINCQPTNPPVGAKLPICSGYTTHLWQLNANATVQGAIAFYPYGEPIPVSLPRRLHGPLDRVPAAGLALAGALMLGLRFRRGARRWLALVLLGLFSLAGLSACGGSGSLMTPATYPYTVSAIEYNGTTFGTSVSTSIQVTIP